MFLARLLPLAALYLAAVVVANLAVGHFGPASTAVVAFLMVGPSLTIRDALQRQLGDGVRGALALLPLVLIGGVLSFVLGAPMIALASAVSFVAMEVSDAAVYTAWRGSVEDRVTVSNIVGAIVDSALFPTLAFGGVLLSVSFGQAVAKVAGGAIAALVLRRVLSKRAPRPTSNGEETFYLGGPINGCTDDEANGWRSEAKATLARYGRKAVDPMERDYRGREMEPGIAAEIVELDKADMDACDVLLMNCPKPSVGTSMEVFYGWATGKRVVCVVPEGQTPSPWLVYHSERIARGSVVDALRDLCEPVAPCCQLRHEPPYDCIPF